MTDISAYEENGFFFIEERFSRNEIHRINSECERLIESNTPGTVKEKDNETVRALHGCHLHSEIFKEIILDNRLINTAKEILGGQIYVHQLKVNYKAAFGGDVWPWHQDTIFWMKEDGLPTHTLTNAMIFLDEVNEFNGPLLFIPGSHRRGVLDGNDHLLDFDETNKDHWTAGFGAKLKYTLNHDTVCRLVEERGIASPKGLSGSVLFFDGNTVHGSSHNMSPFCRRVLIVTYNKCTNRPEGRIGNRPEFIAARDFSPLGDHAA